MLEILRMANRQFRTDEFILTFDSLQTYYKPGKLKPENELLPAIPADKNTVLTNFVTNTILTTKYFFDKKTLDDQIDSQAFVGFIPPQYF